MHWKKDTNIKHTFSTLSVSIIFTLIRASSSSAKILESFNVSIVVDSLSNLKTKNYTLIKIFDKTQVKTVLGLKIFSS